MDDSDETAILDDGTEVNSGNKFTGTITAVNQKIATEFLELPKPDPCRLLEMDVLSELELKMSLKGIDSTPKGDLKKNYACTIEGTIIMAKLEKRERAQAERCLNGQLERFNKGVTPLIKHKIRFQDPKQSNNGIAQQTQPYKK